MVGKAWSTAEVQMLLSFVTAGYVHEDIARALTKIFPDSPRTIVSVRAKLRGLEWNFRSQVARDSARNVVKPRFNEVEENVIVAVKDAFPGATWWQIADALSFCIDGDWQRSTDGIKAKYYRMDRDLIRSRTQMEFKEEIVQKVSSFLSMSSVCASTMTTPRAGDQLPKFERHHLAIDKREPAAGKQAAGLLYECIGALHPPSASTTTSSGSPYSTDGIPCYTQFQEPSPSSSLGTSWNATNTSDSSTLWPDEWPDCATLEDVGSGTSVWPAFSNHPLTLYGYRDKAGGWELERPK